MADEFDAKRMGCPLVQLARSCAAMRLEMDCPKFRKFLVRSTVTGADDTIEACADWWLPLMLRDAVAVMARTEKAVETRGDAQADATNQQAMLLLKLATNGEIELQAEVDRILARQREIDRAKPAGLLSHGE